MSETCWKCGAGRVSCPHREYQPEELNPGVDMIMQVRTDNLMNRRRIVTKHGHKFK